jgi:hypothetical protein
MIWRTQKQVGNEVGARRLRKRDDNNYSCDQVLMRCGGGGMFLYLVLGKEAVEEFFYFLSFLLFLPTWTRGRVQCLLDEDGSVLSLGGRRIKARLYSIRICLCSQNYGGKKNLYSYPCNRTWRPLGLWDVEAPTFSLDNRLTDGGEGVNLTRRPPFAPQEDSWYWVDPRAIARLEGLGQLKKYNDVIGNRTHDLPACSTVPQPTTLTAPAACPVR